MIYYDHKLPTFLIKSTNEDDFKLSKGDLLIKNDFVSIFSKVVFNQKITRQEVIDVFREESYLVCKLINSYVPLDFKKELFEIGNELSYFKKKEIATLRSMDGVFLDDFMAKASDQEKYLMDLMFLSQPNLKEISSRIILKMDILGRLSALMEFMSLNEINEISLSHCTTYIKTAEENYSIPVNSISNKNVLVYSNDDVDLFEYYPEEMTSLSLQTSKIIEHSNMSFSDYRKGFFERVSTAEKYLLLGERLSYEEVFKYLTLFAAISAA